MGDREEQMFERWERQHELENNNNENNDNAYYGNNNLPSVYPNNGSRTNFPVPANATDAVMMNDIEDGETMVNFHGEAARGRFIKSSTFNRFEENPISGFKKNPFTRAVIRPGNIRRLTARKPSIAQQQGGRRRTHKRSTTKRRSVTNKRHGMSHKRRGVTHKKSTRTTRRTK